MTYDVIVIGGSYAGMAAALSEAGAHVVWRCHVGTDVARRAVLVFAGTVAVGFAALPGSASTYWTDGLLEPGRRLALTRDGVEHGSRRKGGRAGNQLRLRRAGARGPTRDRRRSSR